MDSVDRTADPFPTPQEVDHLLINLFRGPRFLDKDWPC